MRVDLEPGFLAVMSIEAAGVAAEPAGLEELAVRRRSDAAAEYRRERLALLLVDQTPQRQGIGLLADVPVGRPGELAEAGDAARLGHAGQAEIEPVGEQARHEDCGSAAVSPVRRWVKQSGNSVHPATSARRSVMRMRGSMA